MPIVSATRRTPEERFDFVLTMNQRFPRAFREPSRKNGPHRFRTMVEQAGIAAGLFGPPTPSVSKRKKKLAHLRQVTAARIVVQQRLASLGLEHPAHIHPARLRPQTAADTRAYLARVDAAVADLMPKAPVDDEPEA